jgi:tRNA-dihydrouridine synthase A
MNEKILSVAPMMDWTDTHCRYFMRLLDPNIKLYTEMITADALYHGDSDRFLKFHNSEHPIALQIGGNDPAKMMLAAKKGENAGYDEININVGCPSDRVISGSFGACLMAYPDIIAECILSIKDVVTVPVTVKTRIGIDDLDSFDFLYDFIQRVSESGCNAFIVHARKAILKGLSPKENRIIPALNYERVYELKKHNSALTIILNGGIDSIEACKKHLQVVDGVMIGRKAYQDPWFITKLGNEVLGNDLLELNRVDVIEEMHSYVENQAKIGISVNKITRHMIGLFHGKPGARAWRRLLSQPNFSNKNILKQALETILKY